MSQWRPEWKPARRIPETSGSVPAASHQELSIRTTGQRQHSAIVRHRSAESGAAGSIANLSNSVPPANEDLGPPRQVSGIQYLIRRFPARSGIRQVLTIEKNEFVRMSDQELLSIRPHIHGH